MLSITADHRAANGHHGTPVHTTKSLMKTKLRYLSMVQALVAVALNLAVNQPAKADSFIPTGSMIAARMDHKAVLLTNGLVLVAGGTGTNGYLISSELYNPANGTWTLSGNMKTARAGHRLTLLKNGLNEVTTKRGLAPLAMCSAL